jgi:hypothetical protein
MYQPDGLVKVELWRRLFLFFVAHDVRLLFDIFDPFSMNLIKTRSGSVSLFQYTTDEKFDHYNKIRGLPSPLKIKTESQ